MMNNLYRFATTLLLGLGLTSTGLAHHSFQVYYDNSKIIKVEGVVESFRFTNPHAIVKLKSVDANGAEQIWTVETTAPVFMARRGWAKDTIKPGEQVYIEGWHSRDGSNLMRMRGVFRPDGTQISGSLDESDN
jgi:hypothetical protein